MKKNNKIFSFLVISICFLMFFSSCKNISAEVETTKQGCITISLENKRTILPTDLTESEITKAEFLYRTNETESFTPFKSCEKNDTKTAINVLVTSKDLLFDVGTYDFRLNLYVEDKLVQTGDILAQKISAGENPLAFVMTDVSGKGDLSITLNWSESAGIGSIKAGLFISAGVEVSGYELKTLTIENNSTTYSKQDVPSGFYMIKFEIYDDKDIKLNTVTDFISIKAECVTTETRTLSDINTIYTITYDLVGGSWESGYTPITEFNSNTAVILSYSRIQKTGHDFKGWYDNKGYEGDSIYKIELGVSENKTYYAKWEPTVYTITFDANDDSESVTTQSFTYGVPGTLNDNEFTLDGKEFYQWNTKADGTGIPYIDGDSYNANDSITLYAIWIKPNSFNVENIVSEIENLETGTYEISLSGVFSNTVMTEITNALKVKSDVYVYLDLSETEGFTELETITPGCKNLLSICLPKELETIETNAFRNCSNLTSITVDTENENFKDINGVLYSKDGTQIISYPQGRKEIEYIIPSGIKTIGTYAFYGCRNLVILDIPEGVTSIKEDAFYACLKLTNLNIPNGLESIEDFAFSGCSVLKTIEFPSTLTKIGENILRDCSDLASITVDIENITFKDIDGVLYSKDGTELISYPQGKQEIEYIIPSGVKTIGDSAFSQCTKLTRIDISKDVTRIGCEAFRECENLASIVIPSEVTNIEEYTFYSCKKLTSIDLSEKITSIDYQAFRYCEVLESIKLPDNLTSLGSSVFDSCKGLTSIVIPAKVTQIGCDVFSDCTNLTSIEFLDPNNWYVTNNSYYKYGESIDVTVKKTNADNFKEAYVSSYWYKVDSE